MPVTSCSVLAGGAVVSHGNGYGRTPVAARRGGLGELAEGVLAARGVPFVVATGYGAEGLPPGHAGVPVLAKPYDPDDLTLAISRLCT